MGLFFYSSEYVCEYIIIKNICERRFVMKAVNLKCEHMSNPMGIDFANPTLSWSCQGGVTQKAYEVIVKCADDVVYDSGKVESSSMQMKYPNQLQSHQKLTWQVKLWDENDMEETSEEATFEMGLLDVNDWQAKWINPEEKTEPETIAPVSYLRKSVHIDQVSNARLYVTAHGIYEVSINGKRVGDFVLAPGTANYDKYMPYQTYDVTGLLQSGDNAIEVAIADGWYRSYSGVDGDRNLFGTELALLLQLENDGQVVCVSDESWEATQEGPLREADMQKGEIYDASKEKLTGWHGVKVADISMSELGASNTVPIVEQEHFTGKLIKTPNGQQVIDYGQNLAGYIEFTVTAHAGDKIVLTHGEALDENGNFTQENFQDRKRHKGGGTDQRVTYICKEGENHYKTKFSIWGFQYALVETDVDLSDATFTSIAVYSQMDDIGEFECGNEDVNKLVRNSIWSQKSNFCDVPTDCPTRERAGWTGDAGVYVDTGIYLEDAYPVYRKWLKECRLLQDKEGKVANIAPLNSKPSFFTGLLMGSTGWGDACIIVPYALYKRYNDISILEENYEMMQKWYSYLEGRAKKSDIKKIFKKKSPYRKYIIETGIDYGEWCEPGVDSAAMMGKTPVESATAYFAKSGQLLSEIAEILGHEEDANHYREVADNARKGYIDACTEDGKISGERMAPYVRAIEFGLLDDNQTQAAVEDLNKLVEANNYHLNTGFLSTPFLCKVLAENGHIDSAYKLLLQDTAPGWLYAVKKGANTIWETWDGINEVGVVKESLNHYAYGAITGWLFGGVCGIKLENNNITIKPYPSESLGYAKAIYNSPIGEIVSGWAYEDGSVKYTFTIPANATAEVELPDGRKMTLQSGSYEF